VEAEQVLDPGLYPEMIFIFPVCGGLWERRLFLCKVFLASSAHNKLMPSLKKKNAAKKAKHEAKTGK